MSINRRNFLRVSAGAMALNVLPVRAQSQLIELARIVNGFPPGTTPDILARRIGEKLVNQYARTIVVENRTGAGGQLAVSYTKSAAPDGTNILLTPMSMLGVYPYTYRALPYDPINDLAPVSMGVLFDYGIAVGPAVPNSVKNIADLMAWYKSNPSKANIASPAAGSPLHFVGLMVGKASGVDITHVAYRGTPPAITDMLGGTMPALCGPLGTFLSYMSGGRIRVLASSGAKRSRFTPDVPTLVEQGFKDLAFSEWYGFFLPAKASPDLVSRLNSALRQALHSTEVVEALANFGMEPAPSTPEQLATALRNDLQRWGPIVKSIGFSADS